jgi:hypothetical protein
MNFLNVPYAEKDEARALGARWNPGKKRWYVPNGVALDAFGKWMPKEGEAAAAGGSGKPGSGRVDAYAAKLVTGSLYVELPHDCNPFEPCAECGPQLANCGWTAARTQLLQSLTGLKR